MVTSLKNSGAGLHSAPGINLKQTVSGVIEEERRGAEGGGGRGESQALRKQRPERQNFLPSTLRGIEDEVPK